MRNLLYCLAVISLLVACKKQDVPGDGDGPDEIEDSGVLAGKGWHAIGKHLTKTFASVASGNWHGEAYNYFVKTTQSSGFMFHAWQDGAHDPSFRSLMDYSGSSHQLYGDEFYRYPSDNSFGGAGKENFEVDLHQIFLSQTAREDDIVGSYIPLAYPIDTRNSFSFFLSKLMADLHVNDNKILYGGGGKAWHLYMSNNPIAPPNSSVWVYPSAFLLEMDKKSGATKGYHLPPGYVINSSGYPDASIYGIAPNNYSFVGYSNNTPFVVFRDGYGLKLALPDAGHTLDMEYQYYWDGPNQIQDTITVSHPLLKVVDSLQLGEELLSDWLLDRELGTITPFYREDHSTIDVLGYSAVRHYLYMVKVQNQTIRLDSIKIEDVSDNGPSLRWQSMGDHLFICFRDATQEDRYSVMKWNGATMEFVGGRGFAGSPFYPEAPNMGVEMALLPSIEGKIAVALCYENRAGVYYGNSNQFSNEKDVEIVVYNP